MGFEKSVVEEFTLPMGRAVLITPPGLESYGEVYCEKPWMLRMHRYNQASAYQGFLVSPSEATNYGYQRFKELTDRLTHFSGRHIPNDRQDYVTCLNNGLNEKLGAGLSLLVNFSSGGLVPKFRDLFVKYHMKHFKPWELLSLNKPGFLVGKFTTTLESYKKLLPDLTKVEKSQKLLRRLYSYSDLATDFCKEARFLKGIVVEYCHPDRDNILQFMGYLLGENSAPSSTPVSTPFHSPSAPAAPRNHSEPGIEEKLNVHDIPNPWDIDIPKIENIASGEHHG